jgi:hypothetical protein
VLVVLSLGILSTDFVWAKRLQERIKYLWRETLKKHAEKAEKRTQDGGKGPFRG